jgi:hypothetical protein
MPTSWLNSPSDGFIARASRLFSSPTGNVADGLIDTIVVVNENGVPQTPGAPAFFSTPIYNATSAAVLFSQDVSVYATVGVQVINAGVSSTIVAEGSIDGVGWSSILAHSSNSPNLGLGLTLFNVAGLNFFRIRVSTYGSGTISVEPFFTSAPHAPKFVQAQLQSGTSQIGALVPSNSGSQSFVIHRLVSALAGNNLTLARNTGCRLYKLNGYNASTGLRFLKLYNKSSAPVLATDVPLITLALKPNDYFEFNFADLGTGFSAGIAYALTTGVADTDTGALLAGDIVGLNLFNI